MHCHNTRTIHPSFFFRRKTEVNGEGGGGDSTSLIVGAAVEITFRSKGCVSYGRVNEGVIIQAKA